MRLQEGSKQCSAISVGGFLRNLLQGFYEWGIVLGDPRRPQAPRLMRAWAELTHELQAA